MHIFIKKNKLFINHYKVKCSIGKRGIGNKIKEGDLITPKGTYKIKSLLYRKDRVSNFKSKLPKIVIRKNMGWCDDPRSEKYNKLIKFPFDFSAEKLHIKENIYDIILVLNFNTNPIQKGKGSAIFIHITKYGYKKTKGCVAVSKKDLRNIIKYIDRKTLVTIN